MSGLFDEDLPGALLEEVHFCCAEIKDAIFLNLLGLLILLGVFGFSRIRLLLLNRILSLRPHILSNEEAWLILLLGGKGILLLSKPHLLVIRGCEDLLVLCLLRQLLREDL